MAAENAPIGDQQKNISPTKIDQHLSPPLMLVNESHLVGLMIARLI